MAYRHADGYAQLDDCELVACADIVLEHGHAFAEQFDIDESHVYEDYQAMLDAHEPDFVSISTPVPTHADLVLGCIESGNVGAIHCEKPMAITWADCQKMAAAAADADVQLTFNHQRRFNADWQAAKSLLDAGEIGELERLEMAGKNIYDFGTHFIDLCHGFVDEEPVEWVMGQVDYRIEDVRYGAHNENQALAQWEYADGTACLASTGEGSIVPARLQLIGSDGVIQIGVPDGPAVRIRQDGGDWEEVNIEAVNPLQAAIAHIVESYTDGSEPVLSAEYALRATEVIFAVWESARRRGRIDLPLDIEDNPLAAMVEDGIFHPEPQEE